MTPLELKHRGVVFHYPPFLFRTMVIFNELRITPDGKYLVIDAQVEELDYYNDVYIESICFDTNNSFSSLGPSTKAIKIYDDSEGIYNKKHIREYFDIDLLQDKLFFVYVVANGTPAEETPCGLKRNMIMGIAYNKYPIYKLSVKYLNELDGCSPANNFINFILRLKAFKLSLKVGNYKRAIEYWNIFFKEQSKEVNTKCGCHGKFR